MKGHDGTWGTLGQRITGFNETTGTGVPMCPAVSQCAPMLQYNCDRLSPTKTAVLDYIGEITVKSIEICKLYLLRLYH